MAKLPIGKACEQEDSVIEVEAAVMRGKPKDTAMGVFCSMANDLDSYYRMGVRLDGYAMIEKVGENESTLLAGGYHRETIERCEGTFHIHGECDVGFALYLYINGRLVEEAPPMDWDDDPRVPTRGWVGLWLSKRAENPLRSDVIFDDFVVSKTYAHP